jgi:radical SAM superfamily enzyme YgiQ (UPF0313 family)
MKLLLVNPAKTTNPLDRDVFDYRYATRFVGKGQGNWGMPLAVPTVAALTPEDVEVQVVDDNIEEVPYDTDADLVGITAMTLQASRAYAIADRFRRAGRPVVLGGVHPSMLPDEAARHGDCVVMGEAEEIWPRVVADFQAGRMEPRYRAPRKPPMSLSPRPARHLLKGHRYLANLLQTTRGCPFDCEFCSVKDFLGSRMRCKSFEQVRLELEDIYLHGVRDNYIKQLMITDDNLIGKPRYAQSLFEEVLIPFNEKHNINGWTCQVSTTLARRGEFLELMARAGARKLFIGFESLDPVVLRGMNKKVNQVEEYAALIEEIRAHKMDVIGSFILGSDDDTEGCFEAVVKFINDNQITSNLINIMVPFPGTRLFERMKQEGRLLTTDWRYYDMKHCVFRPLHMSPEELEQGYLWVNQQIYDPKVMYEKMLAAMQWNPQYKPERGWHKAFVLLRLLHHLPAADSATQEFLMKSFFQLARVKSRLAMTRVVNALDHIDFAQSLTNYAGQPPVPPGERFFERLAALITREVWA